MSIERCPSLLLAHVNPALSPQLSAFPCLPPCFAPKYRVFFSRRFADVFAFVADELRRIIEENFVAALVFEGLVELDVHPRRLTELHEAITVQGASIEAAGGVFWLAFLDVSRMSGGMGGTAVGSEKEKTEDLMYVYMCAGMREVMVACGSALAVCAQTVFNNQHCRWALTVHVLVLAITARLKVTVRNKFPMPTANVNGKSLNESQGASIINTVRNVRVTAHQPMRLSEP